VGAADLRLSLLAPDETSQGSSVDWRINGQFLFAKLSRRLKGDWYGGAFIRIIDANQSISTATVDDISEFAIGNVTSSGIGLVTGSLTLSSLPGSYRAVSVPVPHRCGMRA
jgi:hypothetical protein